MPTMGTLEWNLKTNGPTRTSVRASLEPETSAEDHPIIPTSQPAGFTTQSCTACLPRGKAIAGLGKAKYTIRFLLPENRELAQ